MTPGSPARADQQCRDIPGLTIAGKKNPEFREIGKRMLTEWEQGALDITPTVTAKSRAGQTLKQSVGLSDAGKPRKVKKKAVYRNPDGPLSRKSR